jgi:hypothetical protein
MPAAMHPPRVQISNLKSWPFVRDTRKSRPTFLSAMAAVRANGWNAISATGAIIARAEVPWKCEEPETKG